MDEKLCKKRNKLMLTKMQEELCVLLSGAHRLMALTPSLAELELSARYAAEIRQQLVELERMQFWSRDDALGRTLSDLKRQFLDLEGRLKELRNDRMNPTRAGLHGEPEDV